MPPCSECELGPPTISERNSLAWWLIVRAGDSMVDMTGRVNPQYVEAVFNIYLIPEDDRGWLFERIRAFYGKRDQN